MNWPPYPYLWWENPLYQPPTGYPSVNFTFSARAIVNMAVFFVLQRAEKYARQREFDKKLLSVAKFYANPDAVFDDATKDFNALVRYCNDFLVTGIKFAIMVSEILYESCPLEGTFEAVYALPNKYELMTDFMVASYNTTVRSPSTILISLDCRLVNHR